MFAQTSSAYALLTTLFGSGWPPRRLACILCFLLFAGCQTVAPIPPANLNAPGWTIREGQAVWRRSRHAPELAGDVLLAINPDGRTWVQFSKGSLPFLIAQSTPNAWDVELPTQNQRYSGHGRPPSRLIFLYLPRAVAGEPMPKDWSWHSSADGNWQLENRSTGQSLAGFFSK